MTDGALARWTEEVAGYDIAHLRLRQVAALVERHRPASGGTVLDIGCARGALGRLLDGSGLRYVGCDFVTPPEDAGFAFEFHRADLNRDGLPATLPVADVVVCSGLLEYVADIPALLRQARHHLAGGGVLLASYVNMSHLLRVVDAVLGRTMFHHPDWRGFWSPRDIVAQLAGGGFRVVETYETTRGVRPEPAFAATVDRAMQLRHASWTSRWLAHELLFVARPTATRP